MSKAQNISGMRFGRLIVERRLNNAGRRSRWHCRCDCGKSTAVLGQNLTRTQNPTRSCGCLVREAVITNLHRMRAARQSQLAKQRQQRLESGNGTTKPATREVAVKQWRGAKKAVSDLASALGYTRGVKP